MRNVREMVTSDCFAVLQGENAKGGVGRCILDLWIPKRDQNLDTSPRSPSSFIYL
jgi:hypothetical protein